MNTYKVQVELLTALYNKDKTFTVEELDDCVNVVMNECVIFKIPKYDFFINSYYVDERSVESLFNDSQYHWAVPTTIVKDFEKYGRLKLLSCGNHRVWVSTRYTSYFSDNARYKVLNHVSPVLVYEHDKLVGLICPVRVREED